MRLLLILSFSFATSLHGQDAREIINHYLDTVSNGNVDNWKKIKSTYIESKVYYSQQSFDQKLNFFNTDQPTFHKSYRVFPNHHKTEIYEDSSFTKLTSTFYFLKDRTIILLGNMPPLIKPPAAEEDEFYADQLPLQILNLVNKSKSIELLGTKPFPLEAVLCYEIRIVGKERTYTLYINTETFLLEYWNGREDGDTSIFTKLYNYKKVEGFLIPMSDSLMKDGSVYFSNNIKKYQINSNIDPEIFEYKEK